ncbi:MAG: hypothetical protein ACK5PS_04410 [Desulfopila sp.]
MVYVACQTKLGFRYIYYSPIATNNLGDGVFVHHGLGKGVMDGQWHTFVRDLSYDLRDAQPDNELLSVQAFLIRGSGRVDNIGLQSIIPDDLDSDGDTMADVVEMATYQSNPYNADSDGDGLTDGEELAYWGSAWHEDLDGDGLINLLDADSDGDTVADGREVWGGSRPDDSSSTPTRIVYEDSEDGAAAGWDIYDNDPPGAVIDNVYDEARASRVIAFSGSGGDNGYRLRNGDFSDWNETEFKILQWSQGTSENFTVYIGVDTIEGFRYLTYTPVDTNKLGSGQYVHHGLGSHVLSGEWFTFIRDLEYDLKEAQPGNSIEAVLSFLVRGSGRVDDIMALQAIPETWDSDGDSLTDLDEITLYTTHPYLADSDGDRIDDAAEMAYWGALWDEDTDGDGAINALDGDSDNDGFLDGVERDNAADPADASSSPGTIIYEDGEDGDLGGWDIYDASPPGASLENIFDTARGSKVIRFTGDATNNGFRLRSANASWWYDNMFTTIRWSMNFSNSYVVYIAAQTRDGFRYLYYTTADSDKLGDGLFVHHGLGPESANGSWQTINRDLEHDLKEAQPDNELEYIQGFLIRGNGMVDDIMTLK